MRRPALNGLILALAFGLAAGMATQANAQSAPVPLPPPAPLPKEGIWPSAGATPPPPSNGLRPPAAVPAPAPSVTTVPTPGTPPAPPAAAQPPARAPTIAAAPTPTRGATAFDDAQRAAVERVNSYLNGVSTLIGAFVQIGPDGSRTEGQFYLQKPGRVRFEYNPPSPIELIADGSAVAVRDRRLATQDIYPLSQTPLRFLLAGKIDLMRDANVVGIYQDELFITVVVEEKSAVAGTHRLMIMFGAQDNQLKQWTVTDPQGYDTTIAIYNLDTNQKPDPRLFRINYERVLQ
jgi:outer membrane lipoprotein-sorting protein